MVAQIPIVHFVVYIGVTHNDDVHACNYRYTAELGEHTLLHFLALVALLDKAKERGIVPGMFMCMCLCVCVCTSI
jgi:hypothetical protein